MNHDGPLLKNDDLYPSRLFAAPSVQQRLDPVVYGRGEPPVDHRRVAEYRKKGFTAIRSLFGEDEVNSLSEEVNRLKRDRRVVQQPASVADVHRRMPLWSYGVHQFSHLFSRLTADPRLVAVAEYILGGEVYIHQTRAVFEPGLHGQTDYWHSDFETWHTEDGMPRMRAMTAAIVLSVPAEPGGSLMLIPGSHTSFIACVADSEHNADRRGLPDDASVRHLINEGGIESPQEPPGTVILFDCNTLYGANSNISADPRCYLYVTYNSIENRVTRPYSDYERRPELRATRDGIRPVKPSPLRLVK